MERAYQQERPEMTVGRHLRTFLLLLALLFSILTGCGGGIAPVQAQPAEAADDLEALARGGMPMLPVGDGANAVRMSRLIMGTDHLGNMPNEQTTAVLDEALRLGINTFDTAPIYGNDIESRLGAWLKSKRRPDLHVITKGGFPRDLGPGTYDSRLKGDRNRIAANVLEEVRGSRSRFDRQITIYLMHRDDADFQNYDRVNRPQTPVRTILDALSLPDLRQNYLMVGMSNWDTRRVEESQRVAAENSGLARPVCHSPYFSLFEMGPVTIHSGGVQVKHADMMKPGFQRGVRLMTYSALGGFSIVRPGWEAARQEALALKKNGDRYWGHVYDAIFHEANALRYRRAVAFTERFNEAHRTRFTLDQILNAYAMAHPRSDFVVIGPRSVDQLRRTVQALKVASLLTPEDLDYLYYNR